MAIKSEASSTPTRVWVWVLAACALAAGAAALTLAWQNAELESELNALKREKPVGGASVAPPAKSEQPAQAQAAATSAPAEAPQAPSGQPMSFLDALKASEEAARKKPNDTSAVYPFDPKKQ